MSGAAHTQEPGEPRAQSALGLEPGWRGAQPRGISGHTSLRSLVGFGALFCLELMPKKDVLFIIGDWNAKVGSQETPGVTGKFGLGVQNEAGQGLIEFCQQNALIIANTPFQQHRIGLPGKCEQ